MTEPIEVYCDHNSKEFAADPAGVLADLREKAPLVRSTAYDGFWMALDYELVAAASRDHATFSTTREVHGKNAMSILIPLEHESPRFVPVEMDPPEHATYRRMLNAVLSRTVIEREMRPKAEAILDYFIDRIIESGEGDLVNDIANPASTMLILSWLGLPPDAWTRIAGMLHGVHRYEPTSPEFIAAISTAIWQSELVDETVKARLAEPADDVISFLAGQTVDGAAIPEAVVHSMTMLLINAGVETTTALMGDTFDYLAQHPEIHERILADTRFRETAIEEFLRYFSPSTAHARTVTTPVEFGGQKLERGDRILLCWLAANRDPKMFDNPDEVVLDRTDNRHASFGLSVHRCPGANLARAEMDLIIPKVLTRLPDYRIDRERAQRYPLQGGLSGWGTLPITFTPGSPLGDGTIPRLTG